MTAPSRPDAPVPPSERRPDPGPHRGGATVVGAMSVVIFGLALLCYVGGRAGLWLDPSSDEKWGGLGYTMLMLTPVMYGCPLGLLLGLLSTWGRSGLGMVGAAGNALLLLLLFMWRGA